MVFYILHVSVCFVPDWAIDQRFLDAWLSQYKFEGYYNLVNANLVSARQKAKLTQIWFSYPSLNFYLLQLLSYRTIYLL